MPKVSNSMKQQPRNNVSQLPRKNRRLPISATLLTLAFAMSVVQYIQQGQVSWVTDSFRKVETTTRKLVGSAKTDRLGDQLQEYSAKASSALSKLGDQAEQSAAGLTSESVTEAISGFRNGISGSVVGVTDGDTIKVLDSGRVLHSVRLTGIDAPEEDQPFGEESAEHLSSMLAGRDVFVESTRKDQYGRALGKVLVDGMDINLEQVKAGYAWWYRYYAEEQPGADRRAYEQAEDGAKAENHGLWAEPNPISPYEWRKGKR